MIKEINHLTGTVLDEDLDCSLGDICRICDISAENVYEMIDEGLLAPRGAGPMQWRFSIMEVRRIQITIRLQQDLRVNLAGCALILDLLEELDELRRLAHRS